MYGRFLVAEGTNNSNQNLLACVANNSNSGGIVGGVLGGAAALSAGAPILPCSLFGAAVSGGGPSGGTSFISAAARGFIGPGLDFSPNSFVNSESGPVWNTLSEFAGTAGKAAIVGRLAARASVVAGIGLEAYGAYKAYQAYQVCKVQAGAGH
jgi:hypothetical protein